MSIIYEALKKAEEKENGNKFSRKRGVFKLVLIVISIILISLFITLKFLPSFEAKKNPFEKISAEQPIFLQKADDDTNTGKVASIEDQEVSIEQIEYRLQGIIYDTKEPAAVINGKKVGIGDKIDDEACLVSIFDDGIELETKEGKIYIPW